MKHTSFVFGYTDSFPPVPSFYANVRGSPAGARKTPAAGGARRGGGAVFPAKRAKKQGKVFFRPDTPFFVRRFVVES
ncbi:MAG: hypothetical protein DBX91_06935 [Subdoligranulum variabile]|nr:MAG: hypothetical protein DBX91_06935 [Subdoligranulum variabile]